MKRTILGLGLAVGLVVMAGTAQATPVTVQNISFEAINLADGGWVASVPDWVGSGGAGIYNPNIGTYDPVQAKYNAGVAVPDGENVAFLNNSGSSISQTLAGYTINADATLTLSVDVGWRLDGPVMPVYRLELWAGGERFAYGSTPLVKGDFVTATVEYQTSGNDPLVGQNLTIVLAKAGGNQVQFDNVRFNNDTQNGEPPNAVPEPGTLLLFGTGMVGLAVVRRKRKAA
jgi:hypothetical protein